HARSPRRRAIGDREKGSYLNDIVHMYEQSTPGPIGPGKVARAHRLRRSARNIASVPCTCGHSWTSGRSASSISRGGTVCAESSCASPADGWPEGEDPRAG